MFKSFLRHQENDVSRILNLNHYLGEINGQLVNSQTKYIVTSTALLEKVRNNNKNNLYRMPTKRIALDQRSSRWT